jgi:hypothetical protein
MQWVVCHVKIGMKAARCPFPLRILGYSDKQRNSYNNRWNTSNNFQKTSNKCHNVPISVGILPISIRSLSITVWIFPIGIGILLIYIRIQYISIRVTSLSKLVQCIPMLSIRIGDISYKHGDKVNNHRHISNNDMNVQIQRTIVRSLLRLNLQFYGSWSQKCTFARDFLHSQVHKKCHLKNWCAQSDRICSLNSENIWLLSSFVTHRF